MLHGANSGRAKGNRVVRDGFSGIASSDIYVVSVLIGGGSGLRLAIASQGGMIAHALACAWLFTTMRGFLRIRAGDDIDHRAWMIRSYSVEWILVPRPALEPVL